MKRRILTLIISAVTAACALGMTACDKTPRESWGTVYTGKAAYERATELGYSGTLEEFIQSISGEDGADGVGIKSVYIDENGDLIVTLTNDRLINCGRINGVGVKDTRIDDNGNLIVTLTDGKQIDCGKVTGAGISSAFINSDGNLILVTTDNTQINCGKVTGGGGYSEQLYYAEIRQADSVTGYAVRGLGSVSSSVIEIPAQYRGLPVTVIGDSAFFNAKYITSVTVPDSVTVIEENAFWGCKSLKTVNLGGGVTAIGEGAFTSCESLETLTVPSNCKTVGVNAFASCTALKTVTFEDGVTDIGYSAFSGTLGLESVVMADSVTYCGTAAFMNSALKEIRLSANLTEIADYTFSGSGLERIVIGGKVESIGYSAFYQMPLLKSVLLPKSVKTLASYSLYKLESLEVIYYEGSAEDWEKVDKGKGNELSAVSFYSQTKPETAGRFWHYVDGEAVSW